MATVRSTEEIDRRHRDSGAAAIGTVASGATSPLPSPAGDAVFETLKVRKEGAVLFADIAAPPINLLGPALVRDLVPSFSGSSASLSDDSLIGLQKFQPGVLPR